MALPSVAASSAKPTRALDDFTDISHWHVVASDDVQARLYHAASDGRNALCVDYDFGAVSGYVALRRDLSLAYPANYEFSFELRGNSPQNTLQFKLADASGENVWWVDRPQQTFSDEWREARYKKRHISFAWGPAQDHELKQSAAIEFAIVRGGPGQKGTVCFADLSFRELPESSPRLPPRVEATSTLAPSRPNNVIDANSATAWRSDPAAGLEQTLALDFGAPREFGGLVLHWQGADYASRYNIDFSEDGKQWRTVRHVVDGNGGDDPHLLSEAETRHVRLRLHDGPTHAYALTEIDVKDTAFGASPNAFIEAVAHTQPRGAFPRSFSGEQSYWTVLGVDGGSEQSLLSEDGALDLGARYGSVEPFLLKDGALITWADAKAEQSLQDGYLPIPRVTRRHGDVRMQVTAFASGGRERSQVIADYTLENLSDKSQTFDFVLAVRPFQVNPPAQFLNVPGGVAVIHDLAASKDAVRVNGEPRVFPLSAPNRIVLADFDAGSIGDLVKRQSSVSSVHDETGFATALLLYRIELRPHAKERIAIVTPLAGSPTLPSNDASSWIDREQAQVAAEWREKLNRTVIRIPGAQGEQLANTLRTAVADILTQRAGPALRPGSRAYARSWIRDGTMMAEALLRVGHGDAVRDYADWFAAHQFKDGKVPCCVDERGADPVVENDSPGELIHLLAEYYRYSHDAEWLRKLWPHGAAAAAYMDKLRLGERTPRNESPERRAFYGVMPPSISHEGYSDRPAYSYWDDFWALAGYEDALAIADALNLPDHRRYASALEQFRADLRASLGESIARHRIGYIPGSADRGDFDPTSTTIALFLHGGRSVLPQAQLEQTFERYWKDFVARRAGNAWDVYTPYELRSVSAFARLGWRERIPELLDFFMAGRRPAAWNGWAEVSGREPRKTRFIGDMPHGWVASDFARSLLDLFAYERASDHALVLAAGVQDSWMKGDGVSIEKLRTPYGELTYALRSDGRQLTLAIDGGMQIPPGGLVFPWPYRDSPGATLINGESALWQPGGELFVRTVPAAITVHRASGQ